MRKWQRGMKRILATAMAVLLVGGSVEWSTLKVSATEENTPVVTEGEENIVPETTATEGGENTTVTTVEVPTQIEYMELPELQTSAVSMSMFALRGNENVPLAGGTHAKWIERLDLSGADYAMPFYNWLVENSDNDGTEDGLIDPTAENSTVTVINSQGEVVYFYQLKEITGEVAFTFVPGVSEDQIKAAGSEAVGQRFNAQENFDEVAKYATAVYSAFDRDYPQVFWLSGGSSVTSLLGVRYEYNPEQGTGTATYTQTVGFLLKNNTFDIRATGYQDVNTLKTTIQGLDSKVTQIMDGAGSTTYDKVKYFNEWLTKNNCYNSDVENAGHDVRECISALTGRTDTEGPVCEGYARAFKVLCDKTGIPCVLVSGNADNGSGMPEAHMWNYVQIDNKWYVVDVTWNDPSTGSTAAVSGSENENYFLVGSNTAIGNPETMFSASHTMTNVVTDGGVGFINEPEIETTEYVPTVAYTAPTAKEGLVYNGTEQELVIAGEATGGTMQYSRAENGTYSTAIPVASEAGTYDVWYKVVGEGNYRGTDPVHMEVTIAKATPVVAWDNQIITCTGAEAVITAPTVTFVNDENPSVNLEYSYRLPDGEDYTIGLPDECGTFEIKVYVSETDNYNGAEVGITLTITKADENANGRCDYCEPYDIPKLVGIYYQIENADHLYWFMEYVNSVDGSINAILMNDIIVNTGDVANCNGVKAEDWREWFPIGYYSDRDGNSVPEDIFYSGEFNGNGKTISGLYFNNEEQAYVGLFGQTETSAQIKNLGIVNSYFKGKDRVGNVCGKNNGTIDNCYNTGMVVGVNGVAGGICGESKGTISNCYNIGDDDAVCGDNSSGTITNCYYLAESETDSHEGTTFKTQDQFASGEVAYLLNGSVSTEEIAWHQTIGTDTYPVLDSILENAHKEVYYGYLLCTDTDKQYTNDSNASATKPDHNYAYSAGGSTITASCTNGGCSAGGTIVISASGKIYDGTAVTATVANNVDNTDYRGQIVYTPNKGAAVEEAVNAGTYDAKLTIGDATASVRFTIEQATPTITWSNQEVTSTGNTAVIAAPTVTFVNDENPSVDLVYSYRVQDIEDIGNFANGLPRACGTYDIKVKVPKSGNYEVAEETITLTINHTDGISDGRCKYCPPEMAEEVYQIKTASDLYWFADYVNAGNTTANAVLVDDIVINPGEMTVNNQGEVQFDGTAPAYTWTPIGDYSHKYAGTFDGKGNTISGLYINAPETDYVALFGYVAANGEVYDVSVADSYFSGKNNVATIVGFNGGTINSCTNQNSMVIGSLNVGGIVGFHQSGAIIQCSNTAMVKSSTRIVGGIAGSNKSTVSNCYNTGAVQGSGMDVGGIVGSNSNGSIADCYNTGSVQGSSSYVGAISGQNSSGTVTNCYYLAGCAKDGKPVTQNGIGASNIGQTTTDETGGTTSVTTEQLASGKVAYLLNHSTSTGELAWYQTLNTDTYPLLDNNRGIVYYGYLHCYDTDKQYTNDSSASDTLPDHNITYTAEDETITASCANVGCPKVVGTIVISATGKTYDGTAVTATFENTIDGTDYSGGFVYKNSQGNTVDRVVNAGTYTANLTVEGATASVAFTIDKAMPTASVSGKTFTYNGVAQELVTVDTPAPEDCTIMYMVEGVDGNYTSEIPEGIDAGEYEIKWKISEGTNYTGAEGGNLKSVINKATPAVDMFTYTAPANLDYSGNAKAATVTAKNSIEGMGEITLTYYQNGVETEPVNVGMYTVKMSVAEGTNYIGVTDLEVGTFTINKVNPAYTAPTANTLTYTGAARALVTAGTANGGEMLYSLEEDGEYSTTIPTGTNVGMYTVYYKVVGDANHNDSTPEGISVEIERKPITVKADNKSMTYGDTEPELTYTITEGGLVGDEKLTGTLTREAGEAAGEYAITQGSVTSVNNPNYNITFVNGSFTINKATVSVPEIKKSYRYIKENEDEIDIAALLPADCGTADYMVNIAGDVTYVTDPVVTDGTLSYKVDEGAVGATGTITVTVSTQNYEDIIITVNVTLIDRIPVRVKDNGQVELNNNVLTYGEALSELTFKTVVFVDEEDKVVNGTLAWKEPDVIFNAGTTTAAWVFTPDNNEYQTLEGTVSVKVNKADSTVVTAPTAITGLVYDGTVHSLISQGVAQNGEMQYSLDGTTWNTTIPAVKNAGTYTVYYRVVGAENYNDIEKQSIEVTIAQKDITGASVEYNESFIYNGTAHEPVSIAVVLDDTSLTEADYTISGYANNINAGTASITIAGKGNYTGEATDTFTIQKAPAPAVVTPTAANITYGQALADATLSDRAWAWVDETTIPVSSGNFEAYIQVDDSNYNYTGVQGYDSDNHRIVRNVQVIISKAELTITAKSYSIKVGDTLPAFEYEVTGLATGEVLPVILTVSCTATDSDTAGTYDIVVSGPVSTDLYEITYVPGTLEITKQVQSITAGDVTFTYGDTDKKITATTDGDGALSYAVAEGSAGVITVEDGGTITVYKAGEATVRITAAETAGYQAAEKTVKVTVDKATLTIISVEAVDRKYDGTKNVEITSAILSGILGSDVVTVKFPASGTLTGTLNSADVGTYTEVQIQEMELAGADAANYTLDLAQYLATDVTITKADAYTVPVVTREYAYDKGSEGAVTLDIAALLKSDMGETTYSLEQAEVVFLSECEVTDDGTLKYTVNNMGNVGDTVTLAITVTSQNYEDVSVQVKISLRDKEPEVTPTPTPTVTSTPTPTPASTATPSPTVAPTQAPTATPAPTAAPIQAPVADTTAPIVSGQPYLVHENGTMGWEAIRSDIAETAEGNTIIVNMNGAISVPAEVLADIKGKDITMTYQLSNGVSWTVNGNRITAKNPKTLDFGVVMSTEKQFVNRIPIEVLNRVTNGRGHVDISLSYDGDLGMSAILNVNLGSQNKGYFANLFYYDENRKVMQFIGADDIDANGMAHLVFTHASEYSIVIDKEIMSAASGTVSPLTGDRQPISVAVLFMILASMGIGITLITRRKEDEL